MASTGLYKAYRSADVKLQETGYLRAWISLVADFSLMVEPTYSATPVLGESKRIKTSHTWAVGKEAIPVFVKKDTTEAPADSIGDQGSSSLLWKPKIFIVGDGPQILEMVTNWLNEQMIIFYQDQCSPANYIQFGCDCEYAEVPKGTFASGTTRSGSKGYELNFETKCKYFYEGTISERA